MIRFKQYLLIEQNKKTVKPSPLSADAAIKFGELSLEYAPFIDLYNMSPQEIVDAYSKYNKQLGTKHAKRLEEVLSGIDSGKLNKHGIPPEAGSVFGPVPPEEKIRIKADWIRTYLGADEGDIVDPLFIDDATKLKPRPINVWGPKVPDLRGIYDPEPLRSVVKDSQGRAIQGPIIEPKQIKISPEAAQKVKVAIDPNRVKSTGKVVGKAALKMLPVIGTAASIAAMADRAQAGDYVGAGLEAASEVADYIPGVGTAASLGIQTHLADRDMSDEERKKAVERRSMQALRSIQPPSF
jgi:hypothetical protein